jgi:hypothetical protein
LPVVCVCLTALLIDIQNCTYLLHTIWWRHIHIPIEPLTKTRWSHTKSCAPKFPCALLKNYYFCGKNT